MNEEIKDNRIDLLTCPFCGSKASVSWQTAVKAPDGGPGYLPYCTGCGIQPTYSFFTNTDAVNWWNDRVIISNKEEK